VTGKALPLTPLPATAFLVMYDAIEPGLIPHGGDVVAGYVGGRWPTFTNGELARYAHGRREISIAVDAALDADALDIEKSDATSQQAVAWTKHMFGYGRPRPVLYRNLDRVASLIDVMNAGGVPRGDYRIWSAHWGDGPHVCTSARCTPGWAGRVWTADGTQWDSSSSYDESWLKADFFDLYPHPSSSTPVPVNEAGPPTYKTSEEIDMPWLLRTEGEPGVYLVHGGTRSHVDAASLQALVDRFGPVLVLDSDTVDGIPIAVP